MNLLLFIFLSLAEAVEGVSVTGDEFTYTSFNKAIAFGQHEHHNVTDLMPCREKCNSDNCIGFFYSILSDSNNAQCTTVNRTKTESKDGIEHLKLIPKTSGNFFLKTEEKKLTIDNRSVPPRSIIINFPFKQVWNLHNVNGIYNCSKGTRAQI